MTFATTTSCSLYFYVRHDYNETINSLLIVNTLYCTVFNIIARKTILVYARRYPKASNALFAWYYEIVNADYKNCNQLKADHPSASIVGDDRVVFNIMGNNYRLVVRIVFAYRAMQIKWFGTHKEYNEINVQTIDPRRN